MSYNLENDIKKTKEEYAHLMQKLSKAPVEEHGSIRHTITEISHKLVQLLRKHSDKGQHNSD